MKHNRLSWYLSNMNIFMLVQAFNPLQSTSGRKGLFFMYCSVFIYCEIFVLSFCGLERFIIDQSEDGNDLIWPIRILLSEAALMIKAQKAHILIQWSHQKTQIIFDSKDPKRRYSQISSIVALSDKFHGKILYKSWCWVETKLRNIVYFYWYYLHMH